MKMPHKGESTMNKARIAVGTKENHALLGNFNITNNGNQLDIYYNIDVGSHREKIYNADTGFYEDLTELHRSFHNSGKGHTKRFHKDSKQDFGLTSDESRLTNQEEDPLILGIESFNFKEAPIQFTNEYDVLLNKPEKYSKFSILWFFLPQGHSDDLPYRMIWGNFWGKFNAMDYVRTASLSDILVSHKMDSVLTVKGWRVCACYLKTVLPIMSTNFRILHPKGEEYPWRALSFVDAHIPLANMIKSASQLKRPILTSHRPWIAENAASPLSFVKQKLIT